MDRAFEARDLIEVMDEAVKYNRFLIDQLETWSEGATSVLDFGAGNGRFAVALSERGREVSAIEADPELRAGIAAQGVATYDNLDDVPRGQFDAVYSINVLEHIEDDRGILRALHDILRPGGRLLIYVPAFNVLFSANDRRVGHVRRYRRGPLVALAREVGFADIDARYVDSLGFAAALLYRVIGDRDGGLDVRAVKAYDSVVFPVSRAIDAVMHPVAGKNLLLRAVRPG